MSGVDPVPSELHANVTASTEGRDVVPAEEAVDMEPVPGLSTSPLVLFASQLNEEDARREDGSCSQDGDLQECGR